MKTLTLAALAAVILSTSAFAQSESAPPMVDADGTSWAASSERVDATRIRFGIGTYSAVVSAGSESVGLLGLSLQLGTQLNDDWAVYAMLQGSTALFQNVGNASLMVERELFGHLSVAVGVGVAQSSNHYIDFSGLDGGGDYTATSAIVPVRLAVNLGFLNPSSIYQKRFTIAVDGAAGTLLGSSGGRSPDSASRLTLSAGLSIGFSLM